MSDSEIVTVGGGGEDKTHMAADHAIRRKEKPIRLTLWRIHGASEASILEWWEGDG